MGSRDNRLGSLKINPTLKPCNTSEMIRAQIEEGASWTSAEDSWMEGECMYCPLSYLYTLDGAT